MTYNGWTNWDTWAVHLWLTNDEDSYDTACAIVDEYRDNPKTLESVLKGWAMACVKEEVSFDKVNWGEVARAFTDKV